MQNVKNVRQILAVFALSNMAALIYQISWTKNLSYVFGTSVYAIGTVLACFMAGLAVGSFVFGKRADKSRNPVKLFAYVEIALGLFALFLIPLFTILPQPYSFLHRMFEGTPLVTFMLFALSFNVLIIPTSLIGGTFPIMNRIYSGVNTIGRDVGVVYSIDTVFAAAGALSAGFFLLPLAGIRGTIAFAALINILAGLYLYKKSGEMSLDIKSEDLKGKMNTRLYKTEQVVLFGFFLSGFAALTAEVIWIRFLSLTMGTSIYALSIITASFLIGLSLGSYLISKFIDRIKAPLTAFAFLEAGIGLSGIMVLLLLDKLDIPYLILYHAFGSFYPFIASLFVLIFLLILIPTTLMGATMPVAGRIMSNRPNRIGTDIGALYTTNTFGAISGTLVSSFILIPNAGMTVTGVSGAAISIVVAIMLYVFSEKKWKKAFFSLAGVSIVAGIYLASGTISPLFAGAYYHGTQLKDVEAWKNVKSRTELVHYEEGLYGLVSAVRQGDYIALRINGKTDSSNVPVELVTEHQLAYIPIFAHRSPRDVMLIGLGGGFTLDAVTNFDEIETIDLVEIDPHLTDIVKKYFSEYNDNALSDPRINLIIDDGRNHLLSSDKKYDVMISQPSNIWLSGEGGLFTKEMYETVKAHLNDGGIFGQWMPLYEQDTDDFRVFLATFSSVFPYTALWIVDYDAVLVGSMQPIEYDYGNMRYQLTSDAEIRSDFEMMSSVLATTGKYRLLYQMAVPYRMSDRDIREFSGGVINTDDHPVLEFSTARNSIYQQNVEKPFDAVNGFLEKKYDSLVSPPFTNLISRKEYIDMSFIDLGLDLDGTWKETTARINVDHKRGVIYMEAEYVKGGSRISVVGLPLSDQPLTQDMKEKIKGGMEAKAGTSSVRKEITVNGHWGYGMNSVSGDIHNYALSWFCEHNDILYDLEMKGIPDVERQKMTDSLRCVHGT